MRNPAHRLCDICFSQQLKTAGWLLISVGDFGFQCQEWNDAIADEHHHVCGEGCALMLFGRWLEHGSLEKFNGPRADPIRALANGGGA